MHTAGASAYLNTSPWTTQQKKDSLLRGSHRSAMEHIQFVREEFTDMIQKRYWTVLPAADLLHHQNLRISPLGVVPQHDRPIQLSDQSTSGNTIWPTDTIASH